MSLNQSLRIIRGANSKLHGLNFQHFKCQTVLSRNFSGTINKNFANNHNTNSNVQDIVNKYMNKENEKHISMLLEKYPANIVEAILIAEKSIDPIDFAGRKSQQTEFGPYYVDDFSKKDILFDYDEFDSSSSFLNPLQIPRTDLGGLADAINSSSNNNNNNRNSSSAASEAQKQINRIAGKLRTDPSYIKNLRSSFLLQTKVAHQTRLGKLRSFFVMTAVGDQNGTVGVGIGKDRTAMDAAIRKSFSKAVTNMVAIPRYENRTIYNTITHKNGAIRLTLRPAPLSHGLRVNHVIAEICKCAGISDLTGNLYKSTNRMNVAYTTIDMLANKQILPEHVAFSRGKRVIDIRELYFS